MTAAFALTAALALRVAEPEGDTAPSRSSTIAVTPDGQKMVTANPDSASLSIVDPATLVKIAEVELGSSPSTVSISADGMRALAVSRHGMIAIVDLESLSVHSFRAGREPYAVLEHDGRLFLSDSADARIRIFDSVSLQELHTIAVEPFPRGLAIDQGRGRLYVTHFRSGRLTVIDLATLTVNRVISTGPDSNLSQSIAFSADGTRVYLPQTRSNAGNPALLFDTTVFPIVAAVDADGLEHLSKERISLDVADRPVNMPADAVVTSSGKLYVVYAGSDDLSVIDLTTGKAIAHVPLGSNPRGLALAPDEGRVYASNSLSGTVSAVDTLTDTVVATVPVTVLPIDPGILNGKRLFHSSSSARLARDRWISCATCHPDGGTDGRTWFFRDGPRNTPSLFGVTATLPMHWSGDLDELADVESTIRIVQAGTGLVDGEVHCVPACDQAPPNQGRATDLDDLARFMASLRPPAGEPPASAESVRGAALFAEAATGCLGCHAPPFYTDRKRHDVGTGGELERKGSAFDTPSLRGLYETAPYLHDGSASSVQEAILRHDGVPALSSTQRDELAAFLLSLPFPQPRQRAVRR